MMGVLKREQAANHLCVGRELEVQVVPDAVVANCQAAADAMSPWLSDIAVVPNACEPPRR